MAKKMTSKEIIKKYLIKKEIYVKIDVNGSGNQIMIC
tara:strand:+ start:164 stop:274 length:111 start_codon:yes stop_codon:yes gene_type:complete